MLSSRVVSDKIKVRLTGIGERLITLVVDNRVIPEFSEVFAYPKVDESYAYNKSVSMSQPFIVRRQGPRQYPHGSRLLGETKLISEFTFAYRGAICT